MDWVELGRIGAPFGVSGWMHIQSFTEPPEGLLDYPRWTLRAANGPRRVLEVAEGRVQGRGLVARLEGVADRDAAAALRGASIEVARGDLPPAGERQHYRADLIGLTVRNLAGVQLGRVGYFVESAGAALMVVEGATEHWIPATAQYLRRVDLAAGWIEVDWPAESG